MLVPYMIQNLLFLVKGDWLVYIGKPQQAPAIPIPEELIEKRSTNKTVGCHG